MCDGNVDKKNGKTEDSCGDEGKKCMSKQEFMIELDGEMKKKEKNYHEQ